jgi:hypothetical protein
MELILGAVVCMFVGHFASKYFEAKKAADAAWAEKVGLRASEPCPVPKPRLWDRVVDRVLPLPVETHPSRPEAPVVTESRVERSIDPGGRTPLTAASDGEWVLDLLVVGGSTKLAYDESRTPTWVVDAVERSLTAHTEVHGPPARSHRLKYRADGSIEVLS